MKHIFLSLLIFLLSGIISPSLFAAQECDYIVGAEGDKWVLETLQVDDAQYDLKAILGETIGSDNWSLFQDWFGEHFPQAKLDALFNPSGISVITITSSPYVFQTIFAPELAKDPVNFTQSNCTGGTCEAGTGNVSGIISKDINGEYSLDYATHADISADGKKVSFTRSGEVWLYDKDLGYSYFIDGADGEQPSISGDGNTLAYSKEGILIIKTLASGDNVILGSGFSSFHLSSDGSMLAMVQNGIAKVLRLSDMQVIDFGDAAHISLSPNGKYIAYQTLISSTKVCDISLFDTNDCYLEETDAVNPVIADNQNMAFVKNGDLVLYKRSDDSYTTLATGAENHNLSADGKFIVFFTGEQLTPTDTNTFGDVYIYDVTTTEIRHISLHDGVQSDDQIGDKSRISISGDGAFVAMHGHSTNWFGNIDNSAQVYYFSNPLVCTPDETPVCGDMKRHKTEQCDDGNLEDGDGCSAICEIEFPKLQTCTWSPDIYDVANPLSKIGTYGEWYDFNTYWGYPAEISVYDTTPDHGYDQVALGYYDSSAIGTVSKVRVTMKYISSDGNTTDVEKMNPFLMDTAGNIVDTYYVPLTSSLGGLQSIDSSFQFLNLDDKSDDSASFIFELYLPSPHTSSDLVLGLGLDDGDDATQNVVYGIQNIELEGVSCQINTPPILSLLGISPLNLEVKTLYTDAGTTAYDSEDGDITANIIQTGSVDTNTLGSYILNYDVQDSLGLAAKQVSRTVNVVDTTKPVITLSGSSVVSVYKNTSYTDAGATWTDNYDTAGNLVASGSVDINILGSYTLSYDVNDSSGNKAVQVTRTIHVIEGGTPGITLTGISPVIQEAGTSYTDLGATWMDMEDGSGSLTASGVVDTNTLGSYTLTYDFTDSHGNKAAQVTRTIQVVDTLAPSITFSGSDTLQIQIGDVFSLPLASCKDNYDSQCSTTMSGVVNTNQIGIYVLTYRASDTSGNSSERILSVQVIDASRSSSSSSSGGTGTGEISGSGAASNSGSITPPSSSSSSSSSGGGGKSSVRKDVCQNGDISGSFYDGDCGTIVYEVETIQDPIPEMNTTPEIIPFIDETPIMKVPEKTVEVKGKIIPYTIEDSYESCPIIDALNTPHYEIQRNLFQDISEEQIDLFGTLGIIQGTKEGNFESERNITRAEFTKLVLLSHCYSYQDEDTTKNLYRDLVEDSWQSRVVHKAHALGIISGYDDTTFRPDTMITKAEATKILMKIAMIQTQEVQVSEYTDVAIEWQKRYVEMGESLGVFDSQEDAYVFSPDAGVSRRNMLQMVQKVVQLYR